MSINANELTKMDYEILEYIDVFSSVHKNDIKQHFSKYSDVIDYRLLILSQPNYTKNAYYSTIPNSCYIVEEFKPIIDDYENNKESLNRFHISELGKTVLRNYLSKQKKISKNQKRELFFKIGNFALSVIAIIISIFALLKP